MFGRSLALLVLILAWASQAARAAPGPPDAPTLEEALHLERFRADWDGAERIYRALAARESPAEVRAEALYRLGALLVRRGAAEPGAVFLRALLEEFPARTDLLPRAEAILALPEVRAAPPPDAEPRPPPPAAPREEARDEPPRAGARVAIELRVIGADAEFIARLPCVFERLPPGRPEAGVPDEGALLARLSSEEERLLLERILRSGGGGREGAGPALPASSAPEPEARVHRAERVLLRPRQRVEVSFARGGIQGPPAPADSGFTGLRVALGLAAEPVRRPGALAFEDVELDLELTVVARADEPLRFPGGAGALALSPPSLARQRPAVRLTRERPAALVGGLRDPFSGASADRRGLIVAVSLARASLPAGLDR